MKIDRAHEYSSANAPADPARVDHPQTVVGTPAANGKDHFVEKDGLRYAGTHLIIDLWDATGLDNLGLVEQALKDCVLASGATLLGLHLHYFSENGGISGIAVLAESHISIHTWPERGYAALDIFMCGAAEPARAVPVLRAAFNPGHVGLTEQKRGIF